MHSIISFRSCQVIGKFLGKVFLTVSSHFYTKKVNAKEETKGDRNKRGQQKGTTTKGDRFIF